MTLTWTRDEKRVMWGYGEGNKCKFCDARPREMHTIEECKLHPNATEVIEREEAEASRKD